MNVFKICMNKKEGIMNSTINISHYFNENAKEGSALFCE